MNHPDPEIQKHPRRLWPWVVTAVLLCLFAVGFWFWWPMHRVNSLIQSVRDRGGDVQFAPPSSTWKSVFRNQIHPWYHEVISINFYDSSGRLMSLSDSQLMTVTHLHGMRQLSLNLGENSPAAIRELGQLSTIQSLTIEGHGGSIPTDWVRAFPTLSDLTLIQLELNEDDWSHLAGSTAPLVQIFECTTDPLPVKSSSIRQLSIAGQSLNAELAEAISHFSITGLSLHDCQGDEGFWKVLSAHPTLEKLALRDVPLDESAVEQISKIPQLTKLRLQNYYAASMSLNPRQIESLGGLSRLQTLVIHDLDVPDDDSWSAIAQLPELSELSINGCPIGDAVLAELATSVRLETITLEDTQITDTGLLKLGELSTLKTLWITGSRITPGGEAEFRKARPDVVEGSR